MKPSRPPPSKPPPTASVAVRDPRLVKAARPKVDEPRAPTNRDLIAVERRRRLQLDQTAQNGGPADGKRHVQRLAYLGDPQRVAHASKAVSEAGLSFLAYRYTRQVEIVNEQMGYGERVNDLHWKPAKEDRDKLEEVRRVSQRTKTGRQHLFTEIAENETEEHSEPSKA
jgi:hypothetical protein